MRHNRRTKRFGRSPHERKAMLENMVSSLLIHQEIKTTLAKAKEAKRLADRIITLGKDGTLAAKRQAFSYLQDHRLTSKLFTEVAPRFKDRQGGYTRILQLDYRKGDGAQMALLELTEKEIKVKEAPKSKKGKAKGHSHEDPKHKHEEGHEGETKGHAHPEKTVESKKEKPQKSFFKNIGKFFRNKGGA